MNEKFVTEKLTWLRLWLTCLITIGAASTAWFVANCNNADKIFVYADILVVLVLIISITVINQKIRKNIKLLRDFSNE